MIPLTTVLIALLTPTDLDWRKEVERKIQRATEELSVVAEDNAKRQVLGSNSGGSVEARLESARELAAGGDTYRSLRTLGRVRTSILATAFLGKASREDRAHVEGLAEAMEQVREELQSIAPREPVDEKARPASLRALIDAERLRAWTYIEGAGAYGLASDALGGFYYLGVAKAHGTYARFLEDLPFEKAEYGSPTIGALSDLQDDVEQALLEHYTPPLSQERHSVFIQLSARLKFSRELSGEGFMFASLDRVLAVRQGIAADLFDSDTPAPSTEDLEIACEDIVEQLELDEKDHSLAFAWLEPARALIDSGDSDDDTRTKVAAMLSDVLPDYFTAMGKPDPKALATPSTVTVTLVRWPYT